MSGTTVRANGLCLHYVDHPGPKPPLVLLPGLTAAAPIFEALVRAGLNARARCLALDPRGRGRSDTPPPGTDPQRPAASYTMADHAADVLAWLDHLDVPRAILVGHSFGAMVALRLAHDQPTRFPRLVLLDWATALVTPATCALLGPVLSRLGQVWPSWPVYRDALSQLPYLMADWSRDIEEYFHDDIITLVHGAVRGRARPEAIQAAIEGTLIEDWPTLVARIKQPTLLVNATGPYGPPGSPPFLPREAALATVALFPDARHVRVSGNHLTMLFNKPALEVAQAVLAFVRPEYGPP